MVIVGHTTPMNRQEKLLRHVAMVAKFLDDNKPKIHLKSEFALKLHRSYSISFNLSNVGEIFCLCCVHLLRKAGA